MVQQVQHLLTRFGILAFIRPRRLDGKPYGAELVISAKSAVLAFLDQIGFFGEKAVRAETIRASLYNVRACATQVDRSGPIVFDRVISVEPTTIEDVYDLTVDGGHNFVANDFVVHNSSFCAEAEGALFFATEAGLNHLSTYQLPISTWEEFLAAGRDVLETKHPFKTIVVDTIDNLYRLCTEHVCRKQKVEHESDLGYGKGYALVNNEFYRALSRLALSPYGLYLISHAQERELETRTGKVVRVVPTLPDKVRRMILGMTDLILYGDLEVTTATDGKTTVRRVLRTKPSLKYEAGDRTGRLPETIDLDYAKFVEAFCAGAKRETAKPEVAKPEVAKPELRPLRSETLTKTPTR